MKINRIEISTLANREHYYLREQMYSLAREHNCFYNSEFGKDYITLEKPPEKVCQYLDNWKIKFKRFLT